ncbi:hypothetical protein EUTSA_v10002329mg [Eutrema salsugineum]|uniref:DUF7746 domain-containing protein n=1 Tax=Eutrema salsugineum TaxID=72664 RepID=V4M5J4_EUTSA|nr:hypothetical protein EUTSA_v10002329mg [Eutrema salsugineum]
MLEQKSSSAIFNRHHVCINEHTRIQSVDIKCAAFGKDVIDFEALWLNIPIGKVVFCVLRFWEVAPYGRVVQPKPTKPNEPLEPNTRLKHIEQFHDGKVKLSFIQNHHENIDDYTCESSSLPETIDLGRVSQLAQDFSRMENCPKFQPRFSTSDIPNSVLSNVDFEHKSQNLLQSRNSSVKTYQETNKEFIHALQSQLSKIDIGENSTPQESGIPDTPTSKAQINTLANESYSSESSEQNSTPEINRLGRKNHQDHQIISAPDLGQIQTIEQSRFNSSSVYDWNIDGISEYNFLNFLQKMTMAANAYRTQVGNEDRTAAELLIAGFSGRLKGWWDNYLNNQQRSEILDSVKTDEDNVPILDNFGNPQDKNAELLSNLKCKRLSDFQWYKNTFLTRVLLQKFLAGLPTLLGEKIRNKIRDFTGTQIIDYDDFTYGELIIIVKQEGLKICEDLKLQKHLKWELKRTKVELGSFYRQFEIDPSKNSKSYIGDCSNSYYSKIKPRKYSKTYRNHKSHKNSWQKPRKRFTPKEITNSKPFYNNLTCFKCNDYDSSLSSEKAYKLMS